MDNGRKAKSTFHFDFSGLLLKVDWRVERTEIIQQPRNEIWSIDLGIWESLSLQEYGMIMQENFSF